MTKTPTTSFPTLLLLIVQLLLLRILLLLLDHSYHHTTTTTITTASTTVTTATTTATSLLLLLLTLRLLLLPLLLRRRLPLPILHHQPRPGLLRLLRLRWREHWILSMPFSLRSEFIYEYPWLHFSLGKYIVWRSGACILHADVGPGIRNVASSGESRDRPMRICTAQWTAPFFSRERIWQFPFPTLHP